MEIFDGGAESLELVPNIVATEQKKSFFLQRTIP